MFERDNNCNQMCVEHIQLWQAKRNLLECEQLSQWRKEFGRQLRQDKG